MTTSQMLSEVLVEPMIGLAALYTRASQEGRIAAA
jgi:hypothetical protein